MTVNLNISRIILSGPGSPAGKASFTDRFTGYQNVVSIDDYYSGSGDYTAAVNAAVAAIPNGGVILGWPGKTYTLSSEIDIVSRTHVRFLNGTVLSGNSIVPGAGTNDSPNFVWNGAANGTMFYFQSCFNPSFVGFNFTSNLAINNFLRFDLTGLSGVTGTAGFVRGNSFVNPTANNSYIAVNISQTSTTNQENYIVEENNLQGFGNTSFCGTHGSGTGSTKVFTNTTDSPFNSGMVGSRVRLTYQVPGSNTRGLIDDIIASFTDSAHVTLTTNNVPNQTNITCHVGQCYGVGILNGNSQNAKHHKFIRNVSTNHAVAIACIGGSFEVDHHNGEADDYGIVYGYTLNSDNTPNVASSHMTESCKIKNFESEANMVGIYGGGAPMLVEEARIDNTKASALGLFQFSDMTTLLNSSPVTATPGTNQIVVGRIGGFGASGQLVSLGNRWGMTVSQVGVTTLNGYPSGAGQWTVLGDQFDDSTIMRILGAALQQSQLSSTPELGQWQIISNSNVTTGRITGTGSNTVLAMYSDAGTAGWYAIGPLM